MNLILVRHGVAEERENWPQDQEFERPLTRQGKARLKRVVSAFRETQAAPEVIYTSPLTRARQTAEMLAEALRTPVHLESVLEPGGAAWEWLRERTAESMMVVGHEPDLAELAARWMGLDQPLFRLKKAGMACLEGDPGSARLLWLVTPRWLR